jgi:hypothetical protein
MIGQFIGLIFRMLNAFIFSTVYSTIIFLLFYIFYRRTGNKWLGDRMQHKLKNFLFLHFGISCFLFFYSFSYWQDTGLGEEPSLPIGYEQRIYCPDYEWTVFFPDLNKTTLNQDELKIDSFLVRSGMLCAKVSNVRPDSPDLEFLVCDLKNQTSKTFSTEKEYSEYAKQMSLPMRNELSDFKTLRNEYLDNKPWWRKVLLP